jgi:hypothetical protein
MRRIVLILAGVLLTAALATSSALASSPHFKRGGDPTCTISGSGTPSRTVTCSAVLAGLGGEDLLINVTVSGFAVYQCQNPSGSNTPAGQNKVLVGPFTAPTNVDSDAIKNGNLSFTTNPATLTAPATVTGSQAGCNNDKWTGVNPTLTITSIVLEIQQPVGTTIFTCTASNPNGLSGTVAPTC